MPFKYEGLTNVLMSEMWNMRYSKKKVRVHGAESKKARGKLAPSAGNGFHNTSSLTNAIKVKSG